MMTALGLAGVCPDLSSYIITCFHAMLVINGTRKATVFPDPVWAQAITSWSDEKEIPRGIQCL